MRRATFRVHERISKTKLLDRLSFDIPGANDAVRHKRNSITAEWNHRAVGDDDVASLVELEIEFVRAIDYGFLIFDPRETGVFRNPKTILGDDLGEDKYILRFCGENQEVATQARL